MAKTNPTTLTELDLKGRYRLYKLVDEGQLKFIETGFSIWPLVVGKSFRLGTTAVWWTTSVVTEIEKTGNGAKFYTLNSEYVLEQD